MGQISLPRLNRIGCSMFWESAVYSELKPGLSLKNYILMYYLSRYIFFCNFFNRLVIWRRVNIFKIIAITSYNNLCVGFINKFLIEDVEAKVLKFYFYFYENQAYIFLLYLDILDFKGGGAPRRLRQKRRAAIGLTAYL